MIRQGQLMQVLGSEKVPSTGVRFVFAGMYRGDGTAVAVDDERLQFLATSLAAPDPWSARADPDWRPVKPSPRKCVSGQKRSRPDPGGPVALPDGWMRKLLAGPETRLVMEDDIRFLPSAGLVAGSELVFGVRLEHARMCWARYGCLYAFYAADASRLTFERQVHQRGLRAAAQVGPQRARRVHTPGTHCLLFCQALG